jgi:FKBP-type peptidyl-prolyl cis-trans isomerase FkpA
MSYPAAFLSLLLLLVSCNNEPKPAHTTGNIRMMDDSLLNYNRQIVTAEIRQIEDFMDRYHWRMNTSPTGLRYMILDGGRGPAVRKGDIVSIRYSVKLINGDPVFSSDSLRPYDFETGKARVPNGLEEGVMLLRPGGHAKLIVPSHLAFGLLGDMDKIPSRAILVYDVELCGIRSTKK